MVFSQSVVVDFDSTHRQQFLAEDYLFYSSKFWVDNEKKHSNSSSVEFAEIKKVSTKKQVFMYFSKVFVTFHLSEAIL